AGEVVDSVDLVGETNPSAPETMVSVVTPIEDITALIAHIHATLDDLRAAGVRNLLVFSAFDNPHEAMMVFRIDDESHARHWLRDTDLSSEWLGKAGIGAYPPVFVGRLRRVLQIAERDSTGGS
ncbi:MAG TPA: fatty-acid--CoA ligase, partial [Mycobacterium sp.]|nr:fatty-acid--CoA ligase [Mycobacterium sp.]